MKSSYSYSEWGYALSCLRKYKYAVIDKLAVVGETPSGDMEFGIAVHAAINALLEGDDGLSVFDIMWGLQQNEPLSYTRFHWEELRTIGLSLLSKFSKRVPRYQIVMAEKRLYAEYKGVKLEGTPDFIGLFDGVTSVRDFKTSGYNYPEEKRLVALQLYLYAYLALQNGYGPIHTLGYDVLNKGTSSLQKPITWNFTENKMYEMLDDMIAYVKVIELQTEFPRNPNNCIQGAAGTMVCKYFNTCWGNDGEHTAS